MKSVLDVFFALLEEIKSQSGPLEPIKSYSHPLNQISHPLRSYNHPLRLHTHPLNSLINPRRGIQRAEKLVELLEQYVLGRKIVNKQSSSRASTIAARALSGAVLSQAEIKTLAASVLSQDETKGQYRA